jgi:hypothetical protein
VLAGFDHRHDLLYSPHQLLQLPQPGVNRLYIDSLICFEPRMIEKSTLFLHYFYFGLPKIGCKEWTSLALTS